MKKKITAVLALIMAILLVCSLFVITTAAAGVSIAYTFTGDNAADAGFAEGTIALSGGSGSYNLYWADDSRALDGFEPIGTISGSGSCKMPAYTAIPVAASMIAAFKSSVTNLSLSGAEAVYTIPSYKRTGRSVGDRLYSFAAYSDTHIEANFKSKDDYPYNGWSAKYPYDEQHLLNAFNTAAARGVDFIITTGDHVNNQRNENNGGNNNLYAGEWNTYLKILAQSDYVNPIYEAIGNHELWNYDTDKSYTGKDWRTGSNYFSKVTGLDSTAATLDSGKAYYEITEPHTGDHFLFMALEGGFYTDRVNEFSDDQLAWLESKLQAYENDGKNTFILEHANFNKWGSGDRLDGAAYDLALKDVNSATTKLKGILMKYKNAVVITGHTHFMLSLQLNYSNNNGSSAIIMHNSSVGGVRDIDYSKTGTSSRVDDKSLQNSEGYIVEVYDNATYFEGINVMSNKVNPLATYIIPQTTSAQPVTPTQAPTQRPTQKPTEKPTQAPTEKPTQAPTEKATERPIPTYPPATTATEKPTERPIPTYPPATVPTQKPTEKPTQQPTEKPFVWGDADGDGKLTILDATAIQRDLAGLAKLTDENKAHAVVTGNAKLSILDATAIQRKLAGIVSYFPVESGLASVAAAPEEDLADVAAEVQLEAAAADLSTLRTQAKSALDKYWELASYDQYQALKKAYKENASYDTLSAAYYTFTDAVAAFYPGDNIDVYFQNNAGWSTVYAYCYNDTGKLAAWPGKACTKVSGNVWKVTVPIGQYHYIIFNNKDNGSQTYNLALGVTANQAYKSEGTGSTIHGKPYEYK
jgi:hypothetical protein